MSHRIALITLERALLHGAALLMMCCGPAAAQDQDLLAMFEDAWRRAVERQVPEGVVLTYRYTLHPELDTSEIAALEAAIAGLPDHPDRRRLELAKFRAAHGGEVMDFSVWLDSSGSWRLNQTHATRSTYTDTVVTRSAMWGMTGVELCVVDAAGVPPRGRDFATLEGGAILRDLRVLMDAGLGYGHGLGVRPARTSREGDHVVAVAEAPGGVRVATRAALDLSTGRLVPRWTEIEDPSSPFGRIVRWEFESWSRPAPLADWIAAKAVRRDEQGRAVQTIELVEVRPLSAQEFRAVTTIPAIDGNDPVRGEVTFTRLWDYRPEAESLTLVQADGSVVSSPIPANKLNRPRHDWLQPAGWAIAGSLIGVLVWLRLSKRGSAGKSGDGPALEGEGT